MIRPTNIRCCCFLIVFATAITARAEKPEVIGDLVVKLAEQVDVPALQTGQIRSLDYDVGDGVKSGAILGRVDDRNAKAEMAIAAAEFTIAEKRASEYRGDQLATQSVAEKAELANQQRQLAKISSAKSENDVRIRAAEKAEAVARNEWQRANHARDVFVDSVSESELESLRLKHEQAELERLQAEFDQRMELLLSTADEASARGADIAAEKARVQRDVSATEKSLLALDVIAKQRTLELKELSVDRHAIVSPLDGIVLEIYRRAGEWVRPGDPVLRVANLKKLHAEGFLRGDIRPKRGQNVQIIKGNQSAPGRIKFVSPELDRVDGEYRFLVEFEGHGFFPGESVSIQW